MRSQWPFLCCLLLLACKKDPPAGLVKPPALSPKELSVDGVFHALACGPVTALWSGNADALKDLPQPAPKSFGVESLSFKFSDGSSKGFAPTGQVFFNDWRFDIFAPDCSTLALQIDHYGPYHLVKTADLRGYLEGKVKPVVVHAPSEKTSMVHSDGRWVTPESFEFTASCCGGAQVFQASAKDGALKKVFDAPAAPKGLKRAGTGYEVLP
ncbi:MAG: hypothetical protein Q8L48_09060 [Archangium sp.]|nr:hypothetical protein [Archangium sp.]